MPVKEEDAGGKCAPAARALVVPPSRVLFIDIAHSVDLFLLVHYYYN